MNTQAPPPAATSAEEAELLARLGERVRTARAALGIPRRVLSDRSGVSTRYLAQLESGVGNISVVLLARVATALGVSVADLMAEHAPVDGEGDLVAAWRTAPPEARKQALQTLAWSVERASRVCLIGLRGAGKSTLGQMVGEQLGVPFIELNREIEVAAGMPVGEIIALTGADGYRGLESEALNRVADAHDRVIIEVAGGIVSDADTYDRLLSRFHTIWVKAAPEDHMGRVRGQGDLRPMAGNPVAMAQLRGILAARETAYRRAEAELDTSGKRVDASARELAKLLRDRGFINPSDAAA